MAKTFTNNTSSPKSVNTTKGPVVLQPGATLGDEHEVSAAEAKSMDAIGFLTGQPSDQPFADSTNSTSGGPTGGDVQANLDQQAQALVDGNSRDALVALAGEEGVAIEASDNKAQLAAKIVAARADNA